MYVFLIILGIIVGLNFIGCIINKVFFSHELEAVSPYGQMVEVSSRKMHVYSMGAGAKTIVLLPASRLPTP